MLFPKHVKLVEVSPRDGLQNEAMLIPTAIKIDFINQLSATGLSVIEATSFVSPKWIPQLADNREVWQGMTKKPDVSYPVLVPNIQGLENALAVGVKAIAVFTTPSEQFSQKNTHCSVAESLQRIQAVIHLAKEQQLAIRAYISCALGCPYEGDISPKKVAELANQLYRMGCDEISLSDTIGVGTPFKTKQLLEAVLQYMPAIQLAVHFHDTYGQALTNIYVALEHGIATIDSSVAGLGGCPYAQGASGNVATEDVLYMLNGLGIETGVDLKQLIMVGRFISQQLGREPRSKVNLATIVNT
ncbi:MAG: hydroxymethylglutaryl-CoA lyase [Gammaproteobacteria bacterium RIFCSPHIGHO2_12_FULL_37_14]|nr:MAG: hydroxymethylglutaryl-CoA lyase [Gammaproteobacteria bacterium RIFCSPHIGHO2_12_FULL_37_14]